MHELHIIKFIYLKLNFIFSSEEAPVDNAGYFSFSWIHWLTSIVTSVYKNGPEAELPDISQSGYFSN